MILPLYSSCFLSTYHVFFYLMFTYLCDVITVLFFFFFKQKTVYDMRISDWSSDVCSSDLALEAAAEVPATLTADGPRAPEVWLVEFGDSALVFELVVWLTAAATKRPLAVRAAYNWALESALARYRLEIPRSAERRVGKEWVSTCRSRWSQYH